MRANGDRKCEIKRHLLLGRKAMTNLDSILKSRDITLPTKICLVKAMVFPVIMYGCESWTIKKAEHWRIDAFELWCWRRLLRVSCTSRRSNKSILKETNPQHSLEGLILKLKWASNFDTRILSPCCLFLITYQGENKQKTPILWPPDVKNRLIRKDPDVEKDWR